MLSLSPCLAKLVRGSAYNSSAVLAAPQVPEEALPTFVTKCAPEVSNDLVLRDMPDLRHFHDLPTASRAVPVFIS